MTLIASFSIDDCSFLLGDLLLSGPKPDDQTVHLPSIGDVPSLFPTGSPLVPTSLRRKVCQFSNVSVAWAGGHYPAKLLITRLFDETQNTGAITYDTLESLLQNPHPIIQEAVEDRDIAFLGYLIDPAGGDSLEFGANYSPLTSSILGNVRIAGSGSGLFQEYFDHHDPSALDLFSGTQAGTFEAAVCKALTVTGMLLQLEIGTHRTLIHYFGGGYELIALHRNRFLMGDDLIYAFWFAQIDDKGITISPVMKFFKQCYYRDILIIRTLEMKSPDPGNAMFLTQRTDEVYYFPPIYRQLAEQEKSALPTPDLNAFLLCSYVLVQSPSGIEVLAKFDWSRNRQIPLRFTDDGTTMAMEVQNRYIGDLLTAIETRK